MRTPVSNRLSTPDKAETQAGDSSTAESRDPTYLDEKANMSVTADHSHLQEEERIAAAEAQGEGTSAAVGSSDAPPVSLKEHEGAGVMANGVIAESKSEEAQQSDEKASATEEPAATESTSTSENARAAESEETSHQEDVVQVPNVFPPPPPPPAPEISSDAGEQQWLLPRPLPHLQNRKCLVLDLDETLVHSSFKVSKTRSKRSGRVDSLWCQVLERADFTIPVEIEGQYHNIYVIKRPGVDQFMKRVGELYEVVVFTASVSKVRYSIRMSSNGSKSLTRQLAVR